jgi:hypothetical protein
VGLGGVERWVAFGRTPDVEVEVSRGVGDGSVGSGFLVVLGERGSF